MALFLDGKQLSYDRAFTHDGIQYPKNWLRLTTLEEKKAIGITEVADEPVHMIKDSIGDQIIQKTTQN